MNLNGLRIFCWEDERGEPFVFDLPALDKIGHPVFTETIFDLINCNRINIVPKSACVVDLREED